DSYSAFFENDRITPTGLEGYLIKKEIKEIYLCGLAFDYCVFYSALDGKRLGFDVFIFQDLTKAIDLNNSSEIAKKTMIEKGIKLINFIKN
ncbi:isochorismatase family protein, partial [Paracoccaceae bacterium]|nr:isochorismatase family protein [Paracoccaceae bacterium]